MPPPDCETRVHAMAVEPDGKTRLVVRDQDGFEHPTTLVYGHITAARSLPYMQSDDGDPDNGASAFGVALRFDEEGAELTRVTMTMLFKTPAVRDLAASECTAGFGAHETLGRLDQFLKAFLP